MRLVQVRQDAVLDQDVKVDLAHGPAHKGVPVNVRNLAKELEVRLVAIDIEVDFLIKAVVRLFLNSVPLTLTCDEMCAEYTEWK